MGKEALVNLSSFEKQQAAKALIEKIDERGLNLRAAFWLFDREPNRWRLILAMPEVRERGSRWVYKQVQSLLKQVENLSLFEISVVEPEDRLVKLLRKIVHTGRIPTAIQLSNTTVNGQFIEDLVVHRLL